MATIRLKPGKTEIQATARGRVNRIPPEFQDVPGGLYPLKSAAFVVDEYRIMSGWPVAIPDGDIRIDCLLSGEGNVLGNREEPTALVTDADMRWVADTDYYDQTAMRWRPLQSNVSPWETSPTHAPTMVTDYEYRVGSERFLGMTALNFDSNTQDYMWINLDLAMGGTSGYTVIMVMSPSSIFGNDETVVDNTLWGPETTGGAWTAFTVKEKAIWLTSEEVSAQRGVPLAGALASTAPTFLALVVSRPQTLMYAAPGPSNIQVKTVLAGQAPEPLSTRFRLGWGPNPMSATMDMALFDLSLYGNLLTKSEVVAEFAKLSQVYGGDS
jgi:hypothetical protein